MNKYPHHLGSGGYEGKSAEFLAALESNKDSNSPVAKITNPRSSNWLLARCEIASDGQIRLPQELEPVAQKIVSHSCPNPESF